MSTEELVAAARKRAQIRREIRGDKDRIADQLDALCDRVELLQVAQQQWLSENALVEAENAELRAQLAELRGQYAALERTVDEYRALDAELKEENEALRARVEELEARE